MKSRVPRLLLTGGLFVLSGLLCYFGFVALRGYLKQSRDEQAFRNAKTLLLDRRPEKAFDIIRSRDLTLPDRHDAWLNLEIETLESLRNMDRLLSLYERRPSEFRKHETASLLVARALMYGDNRMAYEKIRNVWASGGKHPEWWFALDVDALIVRGKGDEALKLLRSRTFNGDADAERLIRLALLTGNRNLYEAWQYLEQAYRVAPKNPDVRSFRAQLLERIGKAPMARVEYVAAFLSDPENPLYRDQLADFYRRTGRMDLAVETWANGLNDRSADFIRLKALFWSRVASRATIGKVPDSDIPGKLGPFVAYLQNLPAGRFWDDGLFRKLPDGGEVLENRQEAYWLRVLQALKDGNEAKAYDLLLARPFSKGSWSPQIQGGLEKVLAFRLRQAPPLDEKELYAVGGKQTERHQFFDQLDRMARDGEASPELRRLLQSKEAFAAVFMAGGWIEAALQLHAMPVLPDGMPDWLAYGMTQCLRFNRGVPEALEFAEKQPRTPVLELLDAELLLARKRTAEAVAKLDALSRQRSDAGYRAAWILSLVHLEAGKLENARVVLDRQPSLRDSVIGKEIQARMALAAGNAEKAGQIYQSLANSSAEALTYRARLAFRDKDWKSARQLNMELEKIYPDNMQLRANMKAIDEAEKKL